MLLLDFCIKCKYIGINVLKNPSTCGKSKEHADGGEKRHCSGANAAY